MKSEDLLKLEELNTKYKNVNINEKLLDLIVKTFNTFLNWCVLEDIIPKNPFKGIKFPYVVSPADTISLCLT